jgi:CheY-like chemotaxis protein
MSKAVTAYIIDDDPIFVYSLKKLISLRNYCDEVFSFPNGADALEALKNANSTGILMPDIILLDINMPIMDGWEFLVEYAKLKPEINKPITLFILTSSINDQDIKRAKAIESVNSYITKPVTQAKLVEIFGEPLA